MQFKELPGRNTTSAPKTDFTQWRRQLRSGTGQATSPATTRGSLGDGAKPDFAQWRKQLRSETRQAAIPLLRDKATVQRELDQVNAEIDSYKTTGTLYRALAYHADNNDVTMLDLSGGKEPPVTKNPLISEEAEQFDQLLRRRQKLKNELVFIDYASYEALRLNEDFADKSRYRSTANNRETTLSWNGLYLETGYNDLDYEYINGNPDARGKMQVNDIASGLTITGQDAEYLSRMTPDEIAIYNYLYDPVDDTASREYLHFLTKSLNDRNRQVMQEKWAAYAKEDPVETSVLTVLTAPMKSWGYLMQTADYLPDGEIDQNAGYNKYSHISTAVRKEVSEQIEANEKWGAIGSVLYETGMGMGDFVMNTVVSGGDKGIALAIMGTGAAADAVIEAKERGLSDDQAFALGTVTGLAEAVTEKVSLDALLSRVSMSKHAVTDYLIKNFVSEAGEESTSNLINTFADILISKDQSQWQRSIDSYVAKDCNETEAFWRALGDQAMSLGIDMVIGGLTGSTLGVVGVGVNQAVDLAARNRFVISSAAQQDVVDFSNDPTYAQIAEGQAPYFSNEETAPQQVEMTQEQARKEPGMSDREDARLLYKQPVQATKKDWAKVSDARMQRYASREDSEVPEIDCFLIAEYNELNLGYIYAVHNYGKDSFQIVQKKLIKPETRQISKEENTGARLRESESVGKDAVPKECGRGNGIDSSDISGNRRELSEDDRGTLQRGESDPGLAVGEVTVDSRRGGVNETQLTDRDILSQVLETTDLQTVDPRLYPVLRDYGRQLQHLKTIESLQQKQQDKIIRLQKGSSANALQTAQRDLARLEQKHAQQLQRLDKLEQNAKLQQLVTGIREQLPAETDENVEKSQNTDIDIIRTYDRIKETEQVITDGSHLQDGKLKPNITYQTGEYDYLYQTDGRGRICRAIAKKLRFKTPGQRKPHVRKTPDKQPGDDAGHLIADRFGGSRKLDNLVSQARKVNRSEFAKMEMKWAKALKHGQEVSLDIQVFYEGDSGRPTGFYVVYEIDGQVTERIVSNDSGGDIL